MRLYPIFVRDSFGLHPQLIDVPCTCFRPHPSGGAMIFCQGGLSPPKNYIILRSMKNKNMSLLPKI